VWWAQTVYEADQVLPVLDSAERSRYEGYQDPDQRARFGTGRLVAKSVIAEMIGARPQEIRFVATCRRCSEPHGKPSLAPGFPPLELSISTSGERVAVAVMNGFQVGVDVLRIDRASDVYKLTRHSFDPIERSLWLELPTSERVDGYFRVCARKSSMLKATGKLADYPLSDILVAAADDEPGLTQYPERGSHLDCHATRMFDLDPGAGYVAALSVISSGEVVVHERGWEPVTPAKQRFRLV
jgi:4'-phosphopantetheinyl transferase